MSLKDSTPLVELSEVAVELGGWPALTDVSFRVDAASCLALVGESGCGKSLTCRLLTGLLPRLGAHPTHGSATFKDLDLLSIGEERWRRIRGTEIALVPQSSQSGLDPLIKIRRQLEETISVLDPSSRAGPRALELMELVHMPRARAVLDLYPHELSGGMRQRVMIALALAGRPELLVADEPTTALDVTVQRAILELLDSLRADTGMALVLVTHDLGVTRQIADTLAVMYAGTVVERGPTQTILQSPRHPYTAALLAAQPTSARRGVRLRAIPGAPPGLADRPSGCSFSNRCPAAIDHCGAAAPPVEFRSADHAVACWRAEELSCPS